MTTGQWLAWKTRTTTSSLISGRLMLASSPVGVEAAMPEKVGAWSPTLTFLLNLPASAGLAIRARAARDRANFRIDASPPSWETGPCRRDEAGRSRPILEPIPLRTAGHPRVGPRLGGIVWSRRMSHGY